MKKEALEEVDYSSKVIIFKDIFISEFELHMKNLEVDINYCKRKESEFMTKVSTFILAILIILVLSFVIIFTYKDSVS